MGLFGKTWNKFHISTFLNACKYGDELQVMSMLEREPEIASSTDKRGVSALFLAVSNGHNKIVAMILNITRQPNDVELEKGFTPLLLAAKRGYISIVSELLKYGADPNMKNYDGVTALHNAVYKNHFDIIKVLLKSGADPTIKDRLGNTAYDLAKQSGNPRLTGLFNSLFRPTENKKAMAHGTEDEVAMTHGTVRVLINHGCDVSESKKLSRNFGLSDDEFDDFHMHKRTLATRTALYTTLLYLDKEKRAPFHQIFFEDLKAHDGFESMPDDIRKIYEVMNREIDREYLASFKEAVKENPKTIKNLGECLIQKFSMQFAGSLENENDIAYVEVGKKICRRYHHMAKSLISS